MNKRPFVIFAVFAAAFAVAIPVWAIGSEGAEDAATVEVLEADGATKERFVANCGACHTLLAAGTAGVVGPNLDQLLATTPPEAAFVRVQNAIVHGIGGRMPAGIITGAKARAVADFVARYAGIGADEEPLPPGAAAQPPQDEGEGSAQGG